MGRGGFGLPSAEMPISLRQRQLGLGDETPLVSADFSISVELTVKEAEDLVERLPPKHQLRIALEAHLTEIQSILEIQDVMKS